MKKLLFPIITAAIIVSSSVPAFAQGGSANSGTAIDVVSGGGGGGGGGSAPAVTPAPAPAAEISSFKVTTGKYKSWAAIWTNYTVKNTGKDEDITVTVEEINTATGNIDFSRSTSGFLGVNKTVSITWDDDFGPWYTNYQVKITVSETSTGNVLATQSAYASTGVPKI